MQTRLTSTLTALAALVGLIATFATGPSRAEAARPEPVTVYAAASLTNALTELGDAFTRRTGVPVRFSFAASSLLARQIEAGAPADLFVSADAQWMDYLGQRNRIQPASRRDVATNRLVLIAPADEPVQLRIAPGFALASALGRGRLATADPDTVPAGRYAKSALTALGVWTEVEPRLVRADDVRSALALVARGEVPLGIVYETDARIDRRVHVVDVFPASTHPPIAYPAAAVSRRPEAARLLEFIAGPDGAAAFAKFGFGAAPAARSDP